jgi:thiol-disulfide isomerase/thioredoxin
MQSFIASILMLSVLAGCGGKNDYAIFSGELTNSEQNELWLFAGNDTIVIKLDNGKFQDTITRLNQYFYMRLSDMELPVFFEKGDDVSMVFNASKDMEGVSYSGLGSERLNYLLSKSKALSDESVDFMALFGKSEQDFKLAIANVFEDLRKNFEAEKFSNKFRKIEAAAIDYAYYNLLRAYPSYHPYVTRNNAFELSGDFFPAEFNKLDLNNAEHYDLYREYAELVTALQMEKFYKSIEKNYPNLDASDLKFLDEIKIEKLKNQMVEQAAFFLSTANKDMEGFYTKLVESSTDVLFKSDLALKYAQLEKLLPGMPSASFRYESIDGDFVALEDLKGKYVYIDVWATWCQPCKQEIPALKELHQNMSDKDIVFVSISVDQLKDKETWKKMVVDEGLKGYQLFADNSFRSHFIREFAIESIPRFILIDKGGKIVNADAPRPSGVGTQLYLEGIIGGKAS